MNKKYKISVITPFHNVSNETFLTAIDSIVSQSIGFKNIQWIIVMHNCDKTQVQEIKSLLKQHNNIIVKSINNSIHSPSSPRNYGLKFASGEYIAYLDADDRFTIDALKIAYEEAKKTKSQVIWFRCEYETKSSSVIAFPAITLWNQTQKRIVIDKKNWQDKEMFSGFFFLITSRLFERQFLINNNITFDESIPYGEDALYTITCNAKADRLCYLPQHIGYHYNMNDKSLVQNTNKDRLEILGIAKGYVKIFSTLEKYGIENDMPQIFCTFLSIYIIFAKNLTKKDRYNIFKWLSPFINKFKLLEPNKIWSTELCYYIYNLPKQVIMNLDNPKDNSYVEATLNGQLALLEILHDNANTDFGKTYSFQAINSIEGYKFRVPLHDYKTYKSLINLHTNIGESNIIVNEHIEQYFEKDNGQLIPITKSHLDPYVTSFQEMVQDNHNFLIAGYISNTSKTNDQCYINSLYSMIILEWTRFFLNQKDNNTTFSSDPYKYITKDSQKIKYEELLSDALADENINQIVAFTTEYVLKAFQILEKSWLSIYNKTKFKDNKRKNHVYKVLSKGFDKPIAKKLWPQLKKIIAFGAGELYESQNKMMKYTGTIPYNNGYYFTEEGILGKAEKNNSNLLTFVYKKAFYEFIEITATKEQKVKNITEIEFDKPYQLVVTNTSGLYRYVTDHFIIFKSKKNYIYKFVIY